MATPPILALDLATRAGWAQLLPGDSHRSGVEQLPGPDPADRLYAARAWLEPLLLPLADTGGEVAYERPVSMRYRAAIRVALHLEAALFMTCADVGIGPARIKAYAPAEIKRHATGNGAAKKPQVIEAMRRRWCRPLLDDADEADALAVLSLHVARRMR